MEIESEHLFSEQVLEFQNGMSSYLDYKTAHSSRTLRQDRHAHHWD
jgi:hypothetical protein